MRTERVRKVEGKRGRNKKYREREEGKSIITLTVQLFSDRLLGSYRPVL